MESRTSSFKLTYEDLLGFPEDGARHELLDGEHVVTPSPTSRHQLIQAALLFELFGFVRDHRLGRVCAAPLDVVLSRFDVVEPDLLFVSNERLERLTEPNVQGAPDLVVEVLSDSTRQRDEITKRSLYERFGVREYWVVDPELETVKVYRRQPGAGETGSFQRSAELSLGAADRLTTPLLPGLEIDLRVVFA